MKKEDKTVLYIDDEEQNLEGFRFLFARDFNIFTALNVKEANTILEKNEIKVLISDQRMPEISGLKFLEKVKVKFPDIICIILTAFADVDALIQAVNQGGIYRFILKPWDHSDLLVTINNALDKYSFVTENKALLKDIQDKNNELKKYNAQLKTTVEQLKAAKEKAEESERLKQSFLQNISHEIRTPMNGILGFADLLKSDDISNETRNSYLEIISKSGEQLLQIIENVLDIAKIEAGRVDVNKKNANINELLNDVYEFHLPQINNYGLKFELENPYRNSSFFLNIDAVKLRQILDNLINNAKKFTQTGYIKLNIQQGPNHVLITVKDTGIGISPENIVTVFEPFRQIEPTLNKKFSGTGLGLSITKSYVEMMGGKIWVESELNKGSVFYILLPLVVLTDNEIDNNLNDNSTLKFTQEYTILVVEDEDINFHYLEKILKQMNLNILRADSGASAIKLVRNNQNIDLILMDIRLPDFNGYIAAEEIKKVRKDLPIIAQSAYAFDSAKEKALLSGCSDFIPKPLLKEDLFKIMKNYLA